MRNLGVSDNVSSVCLPSGAFTRCSRQYSSTTMGLSYSILVLSVCVCQSLNALCYNGIERQ